MALATDIGLSLATVLHRQVDHIASNLANMNTPGYQGGKMIFAEHLLKSQDTGASFVGDYATTRTLQPGAPFFTGDPLHVAIKGSGYFAVETPAGVRFTRNGGFSLNAEGVLVTQDGYPVLSSGLGPITVPAEIQKIEISPDGTISSEQGIIDNLGVFNFENEYAMRYESGTLLATDEEPLVNPDIQVAQGSLENANVNAIEQTVNLQQILTSYQGVQKLIQEQNHMRSQATQQLLKTGAAI
ncbi:MAG: flagellar hook-basal body complex protein [Holosporales bacterium]